MLSFGSPGSTKSQTRDLNFKLIVLEKHPGVAINLCVASHHPFQFPWSEIEDTMATHHVFFGAKNLRTLGFLGSFRFFKRSDPYNLWNTKSSRWMEDDVPSRCLGDFWGDTSRLIFQGL